MKKYITIIYMWIVLFLSISVTPAFSVNLPYYTPPIIDEANLISDEDKSTIRRMLRDQYHPHILVVTLKSDRGKGDAYFSDLMKNWGLSQYEIDNTLFIGLSHQTKRIAILVGKNVSAIVPSRRDIIMKQLISYANRRDFSTGILETVKTVQSFLHNRPQKTSKKHNSTNQSDKHIQDVIFDIFLPIGFMIFGLSFFFKMVAVASRCFQQIENGQRLWRYSSSVNKNALLQKQLNQKIHQSKQTNQIQPTQIPPIPTPVEPTPIASCPYHQDVEKRCSDYNLFGFVKKRSTITGILSKVNPIKKKGPRIIGEERQSGGGREF